MSKLEYRMAGDAGILITFGTEIKESVFRRVLRFDKSIQNAKISGIVDTNRAFCKVFVCYDPVLNRYDDIFALKAEDIMTKHPRVISKDLKLYEAERVFNEQEIIILLVSGDKGELIGLLPISLVCTPKD